MFSRVRTFLLFQESSGASEFFKAVGSLPFIKQLKNFFENHATLVDAVFGGLAIADIAKRDRLHPRAGSSGTSG